MVCGVRQVGKTTLLKKVDEQRRNGQFYLTGSQMFNMMNNVSESLAGRVGILSMYSMSRSEIEGRDSVPFNPSSIKNLSSDDTISDIFDKYYEAECRRS